MAEDNSRLEPHLGPRESTEESSERTRASDSANIQRALDLAGAWSDLDGDEMERALDRIRHASPPTPPVEL